MGVREIGGELTPEQRKPDGPVVTVVGNFLALLLGLVWWTAVVCGLWQAYHAQ